MSQDKREREYERETAHVDRQITKLEKRLTEARSRVGELADDLEPPGPKLERSRIALLRAGHNGHSAFWLGAPMLLRMRRRYEGRLPQNYFECVLEHIRELTHDSGTVEMMPESLVWSSSPGRHPVQPHWMVRLVVTSVMPEKGEQPSKHEEYFTTLIVTDRLDALAGRLFGAFGGILGAGGMAAPVAASLAFPVLTPVFVAGWLGGVYGVSRFLYRKIATARAKGLQHVFGRVTEDLEQHLT